MILNRTVAYQYPQSKKVQAEKDYINGMGSLANISRKLDINYQTVKRWSQEQNWKRSRTNRLELEREHNLTPDLSPAHLPQPPQASAAYHLERIGVRIDRAEDLDQLEQLVRIRGMLQKQEDQAQETSRAGALAADQRRHPAKGRSLAPLGRSGGPVAPPTQLEGRLDDPEDIQGEEAVSTDEAEEAG